MPLTIPGLKLIPRGFLRKPLFDKYHTQLITDAVTEAEKLTDAEIVVRVVREAWDKKAIKKLVDAGGDPSTVHSDCAPADRCHERAEAEFNELIAGKTEHQHGVLIFVSVKEKCVEVLCDKTIKDALNESDIDGTADNLCAEAGHKVVNGYKSMTPAEGIVEAVDHVGKVLSHHFPKTEGDKDEISNKPIIG